MEAAQESLAERFDAFAHNTLEYMQDERDLLFRGVPTCGMTWSGARAGGHAWIFHQEDLARSVPTSTRFVRCSPGWTGGRTPSSTRDTSRT
jgi:hypothetical protein